MVTRPDYGLVGDPEQVGAAVVFAGVFAVEAVGVVAVETVGVGEVSVVAVPPAGGGSQVGVVAVGAIVIVAGAQMLREAG
jgi:hypothetical protein